MAGQLDSYNSEIMKTQCPHCHRVNDRCVSPMGPTVLIPAHNARLKLLGLRWNPKLQRLEEIIDAKQGNEEGNDHSGAREVPDGA